MSGASCDASRRTTCGRLKPFIASVVYAKIVIMNAFAFKRLNSIHVLFNPSRWHANIHNERIVGAHSLSIAQATELLPRFAAWLKQSPKHHLQATELLLLQYHYSSGTVVQYSKAHNRIDSASFSGNTFDFVSDIPIVPEGDSHDNATGTASRAF